MAFTKYTKPDYINDKFHDTLFEYLTKWANKEIRRLMIFAPPQHGKSEGVSRRLPAFLLGKWPDAKVIASSYAAELVQRHNRDTQRIIESEEYRRLFPQTKLTNKGSRGADSSYVRNSEMFEVVDRRGSYRAAGIGQGITGMPCDFGIIDDPVKGAEEAFSPTIRQSTWDWYTKEFLTRMASDGSILLTMTRWHRDDLAGRILRNVTPETEQWTVLSFPAMAPDEPNDYDHRRAGEALSPSRYGEDWLKKRKAELPRNDWSALYEQNPRPEGGTEWPSSYFDDVWFEEWPRNPSVKIIAVDPSKGKKETKLGDFSAFVKLMVDAQGTAWVEAELDRIDVKVLADYAVEMQRQWRADSFAVEALQFQSLLLPEFERVGAEQNVHMPVYPVEDMGPKSMRIKRIGPWLARREIRFKNTPGTRLLVEQMLDFPHGEHDDGPDALDMALQEGLRMLSGVGNEEFIY